jgi:hypothetical protein
MPDRIGRTICLFSDTGGGKTTQLGVYAKWLWRNRQKRLRYAGMDKGGFQTIEPFMDLGLIVPDLLGEEEDPWVYLTDRAEGKTLSPDDGAIAYDSGTSASEALLQSCARLSANGQDIGGRPAPKMIIGKGKADAIKIGTNVDSHYMVVQGFMLDCIWRSTWLTRKGVDVIWTFGVHRGEKEDQTTILGPKLAGKALTPHMPKWFNYTFMLQAIPVEGQAARHVLWLQPQPVLGGVGMSVSNARVALDATEQLPASIEPADLGLALDLIEAGRDSAKASIAAELGL